MIKFEKVTKIYKTKTGKEILALDDVSFEIKKGEMVLICGKSGAGKTTVLKLIFGEEKPTLGKVFFEGEEVSQVDREELSKLRRKIGVVFQDYKLLKQKNCFENLSFVMETTGFTDEEIKRDVPKVLELVGLEEKIENFPQELSAGEKQRLAIARALVHRPKVILADEPTGNLDIYNTLEILKIFQKINEMGTTVVLATHDKEVVNFLKRRIILLDEGKVLRDEKAKDIFF